MCIAPAILLSPGVVLYNSNDNNRNTMRSVHKRKQEVRSQKIVTGMRMSRTKKLHVVLVIQDWRKWIEEPGWLLRPTRFRGMRCLLSTCCIILIIIICGHVRYMYMYKYILNKLDYSTVYTLPETTCTTKKNATKCSISHSINASSHRTERCCCVKLYSVTRKQ